MKRVHCLSAWNLACALPFLASACASGPPAGAFTPELAPTTVSATTPAELELLRRAAELPVGESVDVAGLSVLAAAPYTAASGRLCRELRVDQQLRLACDGPANPGQSGWVFVPVLVEGP